MSTARKNGKAAIMSTTARLKRLGLSHLENNPKELKRALEQRHAEIQARVKVLKEKAKNADQSRKYGAGRADLPATDDKLSIFQRLSRIAIKRANEVETGEPPIKVPNRMTS